MSPSPPRPSPSDWVNQTSLRRLPYTSLTRIFSPRSANELPLRISGGRLLLAVSGAREKPYQLSCSITTARSQSSSAARGGIIPPRSASRNTKRAGKRPVRGKVHQSALIRHLQVSARGPHAPLGLNAPSVLNMFQSSRFSFLRLSAFLKSGQIRAFPA